MSSNALKATVVSENKNLLREVSWSLSAYGYEVQTARRFGPIETTWQATPPDFLIVDYDHPEAGTVSRLAALGNDAFTYKLLLCNMNDSLDRMDDLEFSFNDVVSKPLNPGEILARLRAGARFLEFERSLRDQALCDRCTGLLSRSGLIQTLELSDRSPSRSARENVGLVLMSLDFFNDLAVFYGADVRDELLRETADLLDAAAGEEAWIARVGPNAFAMAFLDSSLDQVEELATEIRDQVAARAFAIRGETIRLTATLCMNAVERDGMDPESALCEAEKNLQYAQTLGGSTASRCGEFDESYADWVQRHISSGAAASKLTAQDVMTPFVAVLRENELSDSFLDALRAADVPVAPYLNHEGSYVGVVKEKAWQTNAVADLEDRVETAPEVDDSASCAELVEQFADREQELLVVLRDRTPVGYITCEAMAAIHAPVDG